MKAPSQNQNWRLWLVVGYAGVVAILTAVWAFSLAGPASQAMEDCQREGLKSVANAANVALATSDVPSTEILERIAADDNLRLTLVSPDGSVVADSTETVEMESHADRPEIAAALDGEVGTDRRVSETDGIEYLYVAIPCNALEQGGVLRVSMPLTHVTAAVEHFRLTSFILFAIAVFLAVSLAWLSWARATLPVRRLERVRTDFVANASHELKTPVAGIRLLSESISQASEEGETEVVGEFAQRLSHESARLQNLVNDLMDLSRLEDEMGPSRGAASSEFASIVATSFETRLPWAQKKGLTLTFRDELPEGGTCRVKMSVANATLLVDNLIDNALTYTDEGSVTVDLKVEGNHAVLTVSDTGIGIPPADQDRVFERFYRVDTARSREAGGTGLGLSLVRNAVVAGGGTIDLTSEVGKGSTFCVKLPLA